MTGERVDKARTLSTSSSLLRLYRSSMSAVSCDDFVSEHHSIKGSTRPTGLFKKLKIPSFASHLLKFDFAWNDELTMTRLPCVPYFFAVSRSFGSIKSAKSIVPVTLTAIVDSSPSANSNLSAQIPAFSKRTSSRSRPLAREANSLMLWWLDMSIGQTCIAVVLFLGSSALMSFAASSPLETVL